MRLAVVVATPEVEPMPPVALLSGGFEERLGKAARLGFQGVELMCTHPTRLDQESLQRQLERRGLEVPAIGTGALFANEGLSLLHEREQVRQAAQERARELVDFAARLGALVTIGSFRGRAAFVGDAEVGRRALAEALGELAGYGARQGVRLALEPLNRYEADLFNTAAEALAFVESLGCDNVGLLLDTFHVNIEEAEIGGAVRLAAPRLWHVHLGDSNRHPPGQGHFNFVQFVDVLREMGYDGYFSAELLARPDPDEAARLTYQYMKPLLEGRSSRSSEC